MLNETTNNILLQRLGPVAKNIDTLIQIMTVFLKTDMLAARTDDSDSVWMNQSLPRLLVVLQALNILKNANCQLDLVFSTQDDATRKNISTYAALLSQNINHVFSTVNTLIDQSGQLNYEQKHKQYDECVTLIKKLHHSLNEAKVILTEYKNSYLALRSPNADVEQVNLSKFDDAIKLALAKQLVAISQQRWQLAVKPQPSLHNFAQLREAAIQKEFVDQVDKLMTLLDHHQNPDSLKEAFIALCREREQNQGTCLSFAAMPEGACNQLYWQLVQLLFAPRALADMLKIIMPCITQILVLDGEVDQTKNLLRNRHEIALKLKPQPIDVLDIDEFEPRDLSYYVVYNSILFDVQSMAKLSFILHQQLYEKLNAFPVLKKIIYRQNPWLSQLQDDITLITKKGLTPAEVIRQLRTTLILYGETYTGETYATTPAQIAVASFHEYLNGLPTEKKNALLQLSSGQKTLRTILNDLGRCIETGAAELGRILEESTNAHLLNERYALSDTEYRKIISKYKNVLGTQSDQKQEILPLYLKETLFKRIIIQSEADLIHLLITLPISEYPSFLEYIDIQYKRYLLSKQFAMSIDALGEQKVIVFLQEIFKQVEKFGEEDILDFVIKTDKPQVIAIAYEHENVNEFRVIKKGLRTVEQFRRFLRHLTCEKCAVICEKMKVQLPNLIQNTDQLYLILYYLNETQCTVFLEAIKDLLPTLITNREQLIWLLRNLNETQCTVVLEAIKNQLPTLIQNADQLNLVLRNLKEQCRVFLEAIKNQLPTLITNREQLISVLRDLNETQCTVFLEAIKNQLPTLIQNTDQLGLVLHNLKNTKCKVLLEAIKNQLPTFIQNADQLNLVLRYLNNAQCKVLLEAIKNQLPTFIQNANQIKSVLECQDISMRTVFLKATLQNISQLRSILPDLYPEQSQEILRAIVKDENLALATFILKYLKDADSSIFNRARLFHGKQRIEDITWEQIRKHARRPCCFFDKGNRTYRILNSLKQSHSLSTRC